MKRLLTLYSVLAVVGVARAVPQAGTGAPAAAQSSSAAASPEQYRAVFKHNFPADEQETFVDNTGMISRL